MCTFFSQILALKSRCALYTEPFVFMLGNLHNNTKSAESNNSQFYATSRNKSRQKVCLALYVHHFSPCPSWHQSCNLFTITIENLLHFLEYFDDKVNSMKNFPLGFVEVRSTHLFFGILNKCGKIWKRKDRANLLLSTIVAASLVPGLLVHKNVTGIVQMMAFDHAAAKQQKKMRKT